RCPGARQLRGRATGRAFRRAGIDFKRALLLQYDGKELAQIAYLDPETGPMALCIVKSDKGPKAPDIESRKGMNVVYWSNATHAFMLIGRIPVDR
ncbi:hypothetical protein AB9F35_33780, partial [Rhizobium leguminosarum]